ncbi:uncharacterized protein [Oscarella lobularis]|uniref:uncharacterized protein n=1 Tax=Oscarella lobularis TaxID=121494 RepID=UPI00331393B9
MFMDDRSWWFATKLQEAFTFGALDSPTLLEDFLTTPETADLISIFLTAAGPTKRLDMPLFPQNDPDRRAPARRGDLLRQIQASRLLQLQFFYVIVIIEDRLLILLLLLLLIDVPWKRRSLSNPVILHIKVTSLAIPRQLSARPRGYYPGGLCVQMNGSFSMEKTKDMCGDVGLDGELHRSCMGGSSAVALLISQDTIITYWQYFVVGAAGAFSERGSAISVSEPDASTSALFSRPPYVGVNTYRSGTGPNNARRLPDLSYYLGFSITMDPNLDKRSIYAGGPRLTQTLLVDEGKPILAGSVLILKIKSTTIAFTRDAYGEQIGEAFGYSVAAADTDADGDTDMIVGAPFYADPARQNQGIVYFFPRSRIIRAKDSNALKGIQYFGFTLSSTSDLDGNNYPDILAGSFESNKAVLLRTRSIVVVVEASASFSLGYVNLDERPCTEKDIFTNPSHPVKRNFTCFTVSVSMKYSRKNGSDPDVVKMQLFYNLTLDVNHSQEQRLFFVKTLQVSSTGIANLTINQEKVIDFIVYVPPIIVPRECVTAIKVALLNSQFYHRCKQRAEKLIEPFCWTVRFLLGIAQPLKSRYEKCEEEIPAFKAFLRKRERKPESMMLSLIELLLIPTKRIEQYLYLLEELKNSTPKDHPDRPDVIAATKAIQQVQNHMKEVLIRDSDCPVTRQRLIAETEVTQMKSVAASFAKGEKEKLLGGSPNPDQDRDGDIIIARVIDADNPLAATAKNRDLDIASFDRVRTLVALLVAKTMRSDGHLLLAHIIAKFAIHKKIVLQVFVSLLKAHEPLRLEE